MRVTREMLPGIGLTVALAVVAEWLTPLLPFLGAEGIAMLLGIVIGNTAFRQQIWNPGVDWSEKYFIQFGIAFLGLTVTLRTVEQLGWQGILFIVLQMTATILIVMWLGGRFFKVSSESAMLMGAGNAVCGTSAIAAVSPVIGANDTQRRTAAATVSLTGVALLLILPTIGPAILGHNDLLSGALIGGTLQSVGQAVGAGLMVNDATGTYATLFKMLRVVLLAFVVMAFTKMSRRGQTQQEAVMAPAKPFWRMMPWFVTAFVIFMLVNTMIGLPVPVVAVAKELASFFGVINLAGIGLSLKWSIIKNSGVRFLSFGLVIGVIQVLLALGLIHLLMM
ncbi:putative sulfate exporter family transporter [Weissella cibaria]|uniref:YeiH family protein n=1 Tax=Weissella cibaria TaxID=137591 RepID=UPI0011937A9D|nr:putative sulfate exporter family transporter [Weissella cibaria]TVV25872.1 putative sulfate exporter family transporter [Weissella cibaria]